MRSVFDILNPNITTEEALDIIAGLSAKEVLERGEANVTILHMLASDYVGYSFDLGDVVKALVEKNRYILSIKYKVNYNDRIACIKADTALEWAIRHNNIKLLEVLLPYYKDRKNEVKMFDYEPNVVKKKDDANNPYKVKIVDNERKFLAPLAFILKHGQYKMFKFLLESEFCSLSGLKDISAYHLEDPKEEDLFMLFKDLYEAGHLEQASALIDIALFNPELMKLILERKIVCINDILIIAIKKGAINAVTAILETQEGIDALQKQEFEGTNLYYAVLRGDIEIVKLLLEKGAKPNQFVKKELSVLHHAVLRGDVKIVRLLLEKGADKETVYVDPYGGYRAYDYAIRIGAIEIVKLFIENFNRVSTGNIIEAVKTGNIEILRVLLEKDRYFSSDCITEAVKTGDIEIVRLLIEKFIRVSTGNIIEAVKTGNVEIVRLLIEKAKEQDQRRDSGVIYRSVIELDDCWGCSALHYACSKGNIEIVRLLIENRVRLNDANRNGTTPLHFAACVRGNVEIVKLLIENGAYLNTANRNGDTPLHFAAYVRGNIEIVRLLIEIGADLNKANKKGETALYIAAKQQDIETVNFLLAHGATPSLGLLLNNSIPSEIRASIQSQYLSRAVLPRAGIFKGIVKLFINGSMVEQAQQQPQNIR